MLLLSCCCYCQKQPPGVFCGKRCSWRLHGILGRAPVSFQLRCRADYLPYKPRNDLSIYKPTELESSFIEISNPKRSNTIIGCIYRHPNKDLDEFNDNYLNTLLDKISKENKSVFLLGDFNVDLLKYDKHAPTNEFLDSLSSRMFLPHIVQPTRISTTSKTLIDNIFSNIHTPSSVSGNITSSISDHLPQFLIVPDIFLNLSPPKSNIHERDWNNFDQENFILDYLAVDWTDIN